MSWLENFREEAKRQKPHQKTSSGPTQVNGISGIPFEATTAERFRLTVDVEQVVERETKAGNPCYFLNCRDEESMTFSVIVWESQWSRFQGRLKKGSNVTLDVGVPKEGYSAFNLASVV